MQGRARRVDALAASFAPRPGRGRTTREPIAASAVAHNVADLHGTATASSIPVRLPCPSIGQAVVTRTQAMAGDGHEYGFEILGRTPAMAMQQRPAACRRESRSTAPRGDSPKSKSGLSRV